MVFFSVFEIIYFYFVVAILDLVHDYISPFLSANNILKYFLKYE